jgi:hypothetical protein
MNLWWILVLVFYFSCLMNLCWILVLVFLFKLPDEPLVDFSFSFFILAA